VISQNQPPSSFVSSADSARVASERPLKQRLDRRLCGALVLGEERIAQAGVEGLHALACPKTGD